MLCRRARMAGLPPSAGCQSSWRSGHQGRDTLGLVGRPSSCPPLRVFPPACPLLSVPKNLSFMISTFRLRQRNLFQSFLSLSANMARRTIFVCLLLSAISLSSAAGKCYYPNGAQSFDNFPCDAEVEDGPCCHGSLGWACLSNKLCRGPDGNVVRGSCSDPTWESPECAHFCLSTF
jgi:hypothetical protein